MSEWEEFAAYAGMIKKAKAEERERVIEILDRESYHYAKTHYEGINCMVCRVVLASRGTEYYQWDEEEK